MTNLFISYYQAATPERQAEIDYCFIQNVENKFIDNVFVIAGAFVDGFPIESDKITVVGLAQNIPTYGEFFKYANENTKSAFDVNIISNADIIFDETLSELGKLDLNDCWALSRWEMNERFEKHHTQIQIYGDSQDVWIFRGKIKQLDKADFPMGKMGCISGDMFINYNRGKRNGGRKIKLSDLFYKFNGIKTNSAKFKNSGIATRTESYDESKGCLDYNEIVSVINSGTKETVKIIFESGNHLICTKDHLILNESKEYQEAISFNVGDKVISKKTVREKKKKVQLYRKVTYVKFHPFAEKKKVRGHSYQRVRDQRLSYEANLNGLPFDEFIEILNTDQVKSNTFLFTDPKIEIHHMDENYLNNSPSNLVLLSKSDHAKLHAIDSLNNKMKIDYETIVSISENGFQKVYDIEMKSPNNNFCANGIVVHNCDNRIAYEIKKAGYSITNPSKTVTTWHLHNTNIRGYDQNVRNENTVVSQPYHNVPVTAL